MPPCHHAHRLLPWTAFGLTVTMWPTTRRKRKSARWLLGDIFPLEKGERYTHEFALPFLLSGVCRWSEGMLEAAVAIVRQWTETWPTMRRWQSRKLRGFWVFRGLNDAVKCLSQHQGHLIQDFLYEKNKSPSVSVTSVLLLEAKSI